MTGKPNGRRSRQRLLFAVGVGCVAVAALAAVVGSPVEDTASQFTATGFTFGGQQFVVPSAAASSLPGSGVPGKASFQDGAAARYCVDASKNPFADSPVVLPSREAIPGDVTAIYICPMFWGPDSRQAAVIEDPATSQGIAERVNAFPVGDCVNNGGSGAGLDSSYLSVVFVSESQGPVQLLFSDSTTLDDKPVTQSSDKRGCGPITVLSELVESGTRPDGYPNYRQPIDWDSSPGLDAGPFASLCLDPSPDPLDPTNPNAFICRSERVEQVAPGLPSLPLT